MTKPEPITEAKRRGKMVQKTVIKVKIEENSGKQKGDGPPSDTWSWRKYGQKPIKGSPYPRGYYKCSTSKGCSAKKQVERCKTDASMLIVTYTSTHNHPGPDLLHATIPEETQAPAQLIAQDIQTNNPPNPPPTTNENDRENTTTKSEHNQSPLKCSEQEDNKTQEDSSNMLCEDDGHLTCPQQMSSTPPPTTITTMQPSYDENDFFDELEELPISSSFTGLMVGCFFEERILLPSKS